MNKNAKQLRRVICAGLGLLLLIGGAGGFKIYIELRNMAPSETKEILDGVFAIKDGYVNLFLIKAGESYVAVDAGNNADHVQKELSRVNIDPKKVKAVFLTHSDPDHTAGLGLFPSAVIYISKQEEQMIDGRTARFLVLKNKIKFPYELLEDHQTLTISGVTIRGILMPGHTPGSMSYLINDGLLFTGDSMSLKEGKVMTFNDIFNMDSKTQEKSLNMISHVEGVKYIFTAHYGFTQNTQNTYFH